MLLIKRIKIIKKTKRLWCFIFFTLARCTDEKVHLCNNDVMPLNKKSHYKLFVHKKNSYTHQFIQMQTSVMCMRFLALYVYFLLISSNS